MLIFSDYAVAMAEVGRIEFAYGKCHIIEDSAGVILVGGYAFLIGYCVLGCIDKVLCGTNDSDDREDTYGYNKLTLVSVAAAKMSVNSTCYHIGNLVATTTAARITFVFLNNPCRENYGINYLNNCHLIAKSCLV